MERTWNIYPGWAGLSIWGLYLKVAKSLTQRMDLKLNHLCRRRSKLDDINPVEAIGLVRVPLAAVRDSHVIVGFCTPPPFPCTVGVDLEIHKMTDSSQKLETYLFRYRCGDTFYCLDIPAYSEREARLRVSNISDTATFDGTLQKTIKGGPDPFTPRFVISFICWLRNRFTSD